MADVAPAPLAHAASRPSGPDAEKSAANPAFEKDDFLASDFNPKHINMIVREGLILGGGITAILLQVANPGVGTGVNEHSNFAYRVQDRLRTTMTFVYCMSFGTPEEKRTIVEQVTRVHQSVNGTLTEGQDKGKPYNALDPILQRWVAATLLVTGLDLYERVFGKIQDEAVLDSIFQEYATIACALQMPADLWPRTRREFWQYWDHEIATVEVTRHAREVARDLLSLGKAPLRIRAFVPLIRVCTAEWLPERIREAYGVRRRARVYGAFEAFVKVAYPALPLRVRTWPSRLYLKDMRRRIEERRVVIGKEN